MTDIIDPAPPHVAPDTTAEQAPAQARAAEPPPIAPPLETLIASIRAAVVPGASAETRAAGTAACRSILTVLEASPGQPLGAAPQPAAPTVSPLASLFSQPGLLSKLAAMSREQLLDLVKQVTGAMPAGAPAPTSAGPRFHLIQLPQMRRPGDGS